jgi:uncharacterized protein
MPARSRRHLDPRGPLVADTRDLSRRPGSLRHLDRTVAAPGGLALQLVGVPAGAPLELHLRLEAVMEGVLVSGTAEAPLAGECGRCLGPVRGTVSVEVRELYGYPDRQNAPDADGDLLAMDGDLIDLEQAVRDALLLAMPLSPLCRQDCPGLCPDCGAPLGEPHPEHVRTDPRWAALRALSPENQES